MRSEHEHKDGVPPSDNRELLLLSEIEINPKATQRQLSKRVGIALGLTNVMMRNLAQKGYVRATNAGWKRWIYALTPEGFSHKLHLTVAYISRVMNHYQTVRQTLREELANLALNRESRVAIYGTTEVAELVYLGLREIGIEEIDFYETTELDSLKFLGVPIRRLDSLRSDDYDRVVVASLSDAKANSQNLLAQGVASEKVFVIFSNGTVGEDADG
jgi:hypothetical protein